MLSKLLNISDREHKAFAYGWTSATILILGISVLFNGCQSHKIWFNNKLLDARRSKLLNQGKNIYYFDSDINFDSIDLFKNFINELEGNEPIDIYFCTNGGSFSSAQMIADILLNYKGETNAIVLNKSFSAGTLCVLACKNIYMHPNAHLSPVDVIHSSFFDQTQLSSIDTVIKNKNPDKICDNTFILADQASKCKLILNKIYEKIVIIHNFNEETKTRIYEEIFSGEKYIHSTSFSVEDLKSFGIEIKPITKQMINLAKLTKSEKKNIFH